MAGTENDARYPPNTYGKSQDYAHYVEDDDDDDDDVEEDVEVEEIDDEEEDEEVEEVQEIEDDDDENENENEENGGRRLGRAEFEVENDDGDDDDDDDEDDEDDAGDGDGDDDDGDLQRHPKKRKLKSLLSSYEFAPRVPAPKPLPLALVPKPSGRNSLADWTEQETFALLGAWGQKFLQHGRKSLRSEEWHEVAEKVTHETKIPRTDTQCRNRLDTLKKKYKKEKAKYGESGYFSSKWLYFQKMDVLLIAPLQQQSSLSCGVDSGEYVFTKDGKRTNGLHGMRDSPGVSESAEGEDDDSGFPPPKRNKNERRRNEGATPYKVLADSIHKFSSIYEKIETSKRQQIMELEKMRMDFHRDMELQKRQILEKAQAEIVKIRQADDEENNNNVST